VGGLTVMRAVAQRLPEETIVYLGDTARLPYGTKSAETVSRYAVQASRHLKLRGVKAIIVACNTASAVALPALEAALAPLPVIGVVKPGARSAVSASRSGRIAVIATEGTVRGGSYARAIGELLPGAEVIAKACPLFVSLAEEGWIEGDVVELTARRYLAPIFEGEASPDTLVLGCTHFPVLKPVLQRVVGRAVTIVDSAASAAEEAARILGERGLRTTRRNGGHSFLATDAPERFARVGALFLGAPIAENSVELIDLM
jgi:glutamate racemase